MPSPAEIQGQVSLTRAQKCNYTIFIVLTLTEGVEYAVILPTLYLRLKEIYDTPDYFLGLVMSAFYLSGLFSSPVMGRIYDKTRSTKHLLTGSIILSIVGNIMYWIGVDRWFLFASRLIIGLGAGFNPVVLAEVTHSTTAVQRNSVVSMVLAARQIGLLIGPGCNLFLSTQHFHIGPFVVDKFSAPGIFMSIVYLAMLLFHCIFYQPLSTAPGQKVTAQLDDSPVSKPSFLDVIQETYFVIFMLTLVSSFNLLCVEAVLTPLVHKALFWRAFEMSLLYMGIGMSLLMFFLAVHFCSKRFEDRHMIIFGLVVQMITIGILAFVPYLLDHPEDHLQLNAAIILTGVGFFVLGLPFLFVCHISLFSKLLPDHMQGIGHGIRRTVADIACILGPPWCTSLIDSYAHIMASVMLGLNITGLVLMLLSYNSLYSPAKDEIDNDLEMEETKGIHRIMEKSK